MTTENTPIENQVVEQTPEVVTPETEQVESIETEKAEDEGSEDEAGLSPDSPYAEYAEQRKAMIADGVDVKALDAKIQAGEEYTDEEIALLHKYTPDIPVNVLKSHFKLVAKNVKLSQRDAELAEQEVQAFRAEVDTLAGGSHEELLQFIGQARDAGKIDQAQVDMWNLALKSENGDLYKAAIKQMVSARDQINPKPVERKPANLNLLAQANTATPKAPTQSANPADSLAGNPYANANLNQLCEIKMNPAHPDYAKVLDVMKVKHPGLV